MATATAAKPHDPSAGTSTIRMALSWGKASFPRGKADGVGEEALGGGVGRRRTSRVVDVDVGVCAVVTAKMAADGDRARRLRVEEHPAGKGDIATHRRMLADCRCEGST
jgi:hypothetical protein